jgi:Holliday junction resolvase RusA-like endonuclease
MYSPSRREVLRLREQLRPFVREAPLPQDQSTVFQASDKVAFEATFNIHEGVGQIPDIDNMLKFVLDVMNQCVYHDDRQVRDVRMRVLTVGTREEQCTIVMVTPFLP